MYERFKLCFGGLNHTDLRLCVPKSYEINSDRPTLIMQKLYAEVPDVKMQRVLNRNGPSGNVWGPSDSNR